MEKRLLLIDENDMYRDTFTRILEREFTVEQAADEKREGLFRRSHEGLPEL